MVISEKKLWKSILELLILLYLRYKDFFFFSCHLLYCIFSFACFTSILKWFEVDKFDRSSHTSIFRSFLTRIVFLNSSIEVGRDSCIECQVCTAENVGKIFWQISNRKYYPNNIYIFLYLFQLEIFIDSHLPDEFIDMRDHNHCSFVFVECLSNNW